MLVEDLFAYRARRYFARRNNRRTMWTSDPFFDKPRRASASISKEKISSGHAATRWFNDSTACHGDRGYLSLNALTIVRSDEHKETWAAAYFSKRFKSTKFQFLRNSVDIKSHIEKFAKCAFARASGISAMGYFAIFYQKIVREYFRTNGCHWERNSRQQKYRLGTGKKGRSLTRYICKYCAILLCGRNCFQGYCAETRP